MTAVLVHPAKSLPTPANDGEASKPRGSSRRARTRLSRHVFADVALFATIAAATLASWYMMLAMEGAASLVGVLPTYGVVLAMLVRNARLNIFEPLQQRDLEVQLFVQGVSIAAALSLHVLAGAIAAPTLKYIVMWFAAGASGGLIACGISRRLSRSRLLASRLAHNFAVFGSGPLCAKVFEEISAGKTASVFSGLYEDRTANDRLVDCGVPVTGTLEDLVDAAREGRVDEILIALPQSATRRIKEVARRFDALPVDVHICTHIATEFPGRQLEDFRTSMLGAVGMLQLRQKPIRDWSAPLKRVEDLVVGLALLIAAAPVMVAAAAAIKLDSPGPVFFRQKRMGLNNQKISVWKFRSMHVAENGPSIVQATRNDPRVTRVGRFIRRTSIDELPQLFNVLKGEMSLVGPRPHALAHDNFFGNIIRRYANRHQVKPGMTGLAQVSGYRGETKDPRLMQKRVQYDLWYIENWSILLDLKIILMTPLACLMNKNTY